MNDPENLMSTDCGGDCWGCIGEIEYEGPDGENEWNTNTYIEIRAGMRDQNAKALE